MTPRAIHGFASLLAVGLILVPAHAQLRVTLSTSDVAVDLKGGAVDLRLRAPAVADTP